MLLLGCNSGAERPDEAATVVPGPVAQHAVEITIPSVLRGLPVARAGGAPEAPVVRCRTCHEVGDTRPFPERAETLGGPHAGLTVEHGSLRCAACHDADDREQLHLADGRAIPMIDALELCSQCHGPQRRDYDHGAHGGMRGHWDLSRGPREKNHCVACHDPHGPRFGVFAPVPGARDRFTGQGGKKHE